MTDCKSLSPSLEDYLETILILETEFRVARVRDIASRLSVQMPSVTGAVKNLRDKGLVNYEKNSFISLTSEGKALAEEVFLKHSILSDFLENILLLPHDKAVEQACRMEHDIDAVTSGRFRNCSSYIKELISGAAVSSEDWKKRITAGE